MNKSKKRNIIIGSLCVVVLLMAVGYAAFQTVLNIQGTSNITSSWNVKITNVISKNIVGTASNNGDPSFEELSATFKTSLQAPGDSIEYDITVTNNGSLDAKLDEITLSDTNNPAIKFTATGMTKGDVITAGNTKVLTVKVEYLSNVSEQPTNTTSTLTVDLDYSQATGTTPSGESASEKLIATTVTTGDGLYADGYEEGRYVYKGANPSNYIIFNNEEWRIISVEADGTLKIVRMANLGSRPYDVAGNRDNASNGAGGTYCSSSAKGCNVWAKTDNFINGSLSGTVLKNSSLNEYLNAEYYNSLDDIAKDKIQNHVFYYGPVDSLDDSQTIESTIEAEKKYSWMGNIGLMQASDYVRATFDPLCISINSGVSAPYHCGQFNFLTLGDTQWPWLLNAFPSTNYGIFTISENGFIHMGVDGAKGDRAVWPSLYLKSDIQLSGKGTEANPYSIK